MLKFKISCVTSRIVLFTEFECGVDIAEGSFLDSWNMCNFNQDYTGIVKLPLHRYNSIAYEVYKHV